MGRCAFFILVGTGTCAALFLTGCDGDILDSHDTSRDSCLTFAHVGFGPVRETWQCFDRFDHVRAQPTVSLTRLGGESDGYGEVHVGGEIHPATFRVHGLDWRWDFGCDESRRSYPFAFTIDPEGSGLYYHFLRTRDGTATPSDFYDCEMTP